MVKYLILILFVCLMVVTGFLSRKKVNNINDFFLGGRSMGPWISAFSYGTTYFSAVILIGVSGKMGYGYGISAMWIAFGNAVFGSYLAWKVLAKRTRAMTIQLDASTMPDFFYKRYNSRFLKIFSALIIFVFLLPYSASVYQGLGYLFEQAFNLDYRIVMGLMALLTLVYLVLGGYVASAVNGLFQGIIMLVGLSLMVIYVIKSPMIGSISKGFEGLNAIDSSLVKPFSKDPFSMFSIVFLTSIGVWGLPQMVHKYYAIKDEKAIKSGTIISTVFAIVIAGGAYLVGSFSRLFFLEGGLVMPEKIDQMIPVILSSTLPEALFGLIIILVLSASMSTLSSIVLVSSSAISIDLFKNMIKKDMKDKEVMLLTRLLCALFVIVSVLLAFTNSPILSLMSFSWATLAGAFLAPYLLGLYSKTTSKYPAIFSMVGGLVISFGGALLFGMDASMASKLGTIAVICSILIFKLTENVVSIKQNDKVYNEV